MSLLTASDKALWRLALPMIFSNITVPLLGLVDTAVIGHLDSPVYLGGVAIGATATSFLFMLLLFLRMSTTGLTAQAYGAKDPLRLARALVQPLILALGAGALIVVLRAPLIDLALHIVGGSEAVLAQARRFLEIRWLSAPASLANLVLLGWLLGVQYARAPVILLVVGNLLNIVLDVWLVMGLHMNVQGAALATAIAEYGTFIIGLWMVRRVLAMRGISLALLKTAWHGNIRKLLALNRDIMLRSLLLQLCFGALTVFGARLGPEIVAVNAVLMTLLTLPPMRWTVLPTRLNRIPGRRTGRAKAGSYGRSGGLPAVSRGWWRWPLVWFTPASVSRSLHCLPLSLRCASWRATISSGKSSYRWLASGVICWTACLLGRRAEPKCATVWLSRRPDLA